MGFISPRAHISKSALYDSSLRLFGEVSIGNLTCLDQMVTVGLPTQKLVDKHLRLGIPDSGIDINQLYELSAEHRTSIGESCTVRSGAVIYNGCTLGDSVQVAHHTVIRESSQVGAFTSIFPHTSLRRSVRIGSGCRIGGVVGDRAVIGNYVTSLGQLVHDYAAAVGGEVEAAPTLMTGVTVGRNAVIVGGVTVGQYALIAAGAVVLRNVPECVIVGGNPARVVGVRDSGQIERIRSRIQEGGYL